MEKCDICGVNAAKYVCGACGRHVCEECFDSFEGRCRLCLGKNRLIDLQKKHPSFSFKILAIGLGILFFGVIVIILSSFLGNGQVSGTLIIFIGPIPIVFGHGQHFFLPLVLTVIFTVIGILFFLATGKGINREE